MAYMSYGGTEPQQLIFISLDLIIDFAPGCPHVLDLRSRTEIEEVEMPGWNVSRCFWVTFSSALSVPIQSLSGDMVGGPFAA